MSLAVHKLKVIAAFVYFYSFPTNSMSSNEGSNTGPIDSAASVCYNTIFVSPPNEPKRITRLTGQFPSAGNYFFGFLTLQLEHN
jgi:hypothetical protein